MARLKVLRWVLLAIAVLAAVAGVYSSVALRRRMAEVEASGRRSFKAVRGPLEAEFDGVLDFAYVTCGFGGGKLDLSRATIAESPATLDVAAYMGGAQIRIPAEWRVRNETTAVMGGLGESRKSAPREADGPELVVRGRMVMGGFDLIG